MGSGDIGGFSEVGEKIETFNEEEIEIEKGDGQKGEELNTQTQQN